MSTLRYNYLLSVIHRLEAETQTADAIAARILKDGDMTALTSTDITDLGLAVQSCVMLAREAALQIPMVAEIIYD